METNNLTLAMHSDGDGRSIDRTSIPEQYLKWRTERAPSTANMTYEDRDSFFSVAMLGVKKSTFPTPKQGSS